MPPTLDEHINQLKQTIADIESQRSILGDEVVEASLKPIRKKLADLESGVDSSTEDLSNIPERKRKLVTLLFLDVVGSTAMTQDLDPEDTLDMMDHALKQLAEPVGAHAGRVTRYTGDGFKAIFGDPVSRENDPELAIRAGLEILELANCISQEIEKERGVMDFKVRIGIDTGLAAIGGQTESEDTVMGKVVNLAVRIESAAPPGGLLISHNTYRHVRGVFNVEPQEPISAKGFPEPVPVYLVKEIKPRAFRVQTRGVEGIETRMVGRNDELRFLQDALMTAFEEREGHVVTVSGEAGVGKSRLLYEFQNWLELLPSSQPVRFFQGRGKQETKNSPYSLLRDVFASRFQITDDDTGEKARNRIESGFREVLGKDEVGEMKAHILGQLLGFDFSTSPHLKGVLNDAEQLRNRGVMYLIQYFHELSQEMPVVIFLEDIHWGDDSSLDVVSRIGEYTPQHPVLLVCAARPVLFERRPYWGEGQPYHTRLELRPLSKRESRTLVSEILKLTDDIPDELRELVVTGAEGNPFYTEELIKMLIEDRVILPDEDTWQIDLTRLEEIDVPSTLAGVLQARLDSLPTRERTVLQQASVVGRLFWDRIVAYIQAEGGKNVDPQSIPRALTSLRNRELVYRHEESAFIGAVEYLFKHDVLREVTYESVLKRLRKTYHGLVADWLIANCGDRIGEYSGLIGEHSLLGGGNEQALEYFKQAGNLALSSYANDEAEGYYRKALNVSQQDHDRADLLAGLGESLYRQGKSGKASSIWQQAISLYQELGDSNKLGETYARLSLLLWFTDNLKAWDLCKEGLKLLEGEPDSTGYARLLAEGGRTALFSDVDDQVIPLCQRAIEMAQRVGNLEVQVEASTTLALDKFDEIESIKILKEVAEMAETNGLLRTASRAHNNIGAILDDYFVDLHSSLMHTLRAVEIIIEIGDFEGMMLFMKNVYSALIDLGELSTVEEKVIEYFQSSSVPETRVEEFLHDLQPDVMKARGDWYSALERLQLAQRELQDNGNKQALINNNYDVARIILEIHRFGDSIDLSRAEGALLENIELSQFVWNTRFCLAIVYIRQGRLEDAHDHYDQSYKLLPQTQNLKMYTKEIRTEIQYEMAYAEGRWEEAIAVWESLLDTYQQGGYRRKWARRLIDLGDALVGRNEPGDRERARETYQQSLDMFTEMGAPGYVRVLEERLGELQR